MSNNEFQNYLPDSIPLSKRLAKQAASSDSFSLEFQSSTKENKRAGSQLALYTWGTLATLSMILAAGFLVTEIKIQETKRLVDMQIQQHKRSTLVSVQTKNDEELAVIPQPKTPTLSLAKSLVPADSTDQLTTASLGKGQERINGAQVIGFGVSIGSSTSMKVLSSRFLALSNHAPELFIGLKPKVQFTRPIQKKKTAKLVVGPFHSESELYTFCKKVRSRMAVDCTQENYIGNKLLLPPIL